MTTIWSSPQVRGYPPPPLLCPQISPSPFAAAAAAAAASELYHPARFLLLLLLVVTITITIAGWIEVPSKSDPSQIRYMNLLTYQRVKKRPRRGATSTWITSSGRHVKTMDAHPLHVGNGKGAQTDGSCS